MIDLARGVRAIVLAVLLVAGLGACQQAPSGEAGNGGDGARWNEAEWDDDIWN